LKAIERNKNMPASILEKYKRQIPGFNEKDPPLVVNISDVMHGIKKELTKEGKPFIEIPAGKKIKKEEVPV
jgi:hypothetical protein